MERKPNNTHDAKIPAKGPVVICGPACSGKTSRVIDIYRNSLLPDGTSSCMIITPNSASQRFAKNRLIELGDSGLVVKPNVTTFTAFAAGVLSDNNSTARNITAFKRHLILAGIISRLGKAGRFRALANVCDTPGLVTCVDTVISQLKRAAADPEDIRAITPANMLRQMDIVEIYSQYQLHLQQNNLVDVEGQMWLARDLLASAHLPESLATLTTIAVDGFTDFTPTQLEILKILSGLIGSVAITLPLDNDNRKRMWFWTNRTLERIKKTFSGKCGVVNLSSDAPPALHSRIFDPQPEKIPGHCQPKLIAAHCCEDEIARIAFEIKKLLLANSTSQSIAVLCNNLPQYHSLIYRTFKSCGIPVAPPATPLGDVPIIRYIVDFARLGPNFEFEKMLAVLGSSYFNPSFLGDFTTRDANVAAMIIRECNVLENADSYLQAAEKLLARLGSTIIDDEDEQQTISLGSIDISGTVILKAAELFKAIFRTAAKIAKNPASAIGLLDLRQAAIKAREPELVSRDLRALKLFETLCEDEDIKTADIGNFTQALSMVFNPSTRSESLVDVISVLDARCLRYGHVFIVGMNEGVFPSRSADNALLSVQNRNRLIQHGVALDNRFDLSSREMLLFYMAITRPDASLTLSYVKSDASGQAKAPGSYIETLEGLFSEISVETIPAGQIIPQSPDRLVSNEDILNAGIWSVVNSQSPGVFTQAIKWMKDTKPQLVANISRGIFARNRRSQPGPYDNFDGVLSDNRIIEELKRTYPANTVFSASMLNCYGICPWRFFARYILKLKPLALPAQQLQPATQGTFIHDVLFSFFSELREKCSGPVELENFSHDELYGLLEKHVYLQAQTLDAKALYPQLWDVTKNQMLKMLRRYMHDITGGLKISRFSPRPAYFEFSFGMKLQSPACDPASVEDFAEIKTPYGPARLGGKIDRIDITDHKDSIPSCIVIDYKTSSLGPRKDILEARNLQPVLYPLAVQQILGDRFAVCGGALHQITAATSKSRELNFNELIGRDAANYKNDFESVLNRIILHIENMRSGNFQVHPTTEKCPQYCPFRKICGYSPARRELKESLIAADISTGEDDQQ